MAAVEVAAMEVDEVAAAMAGEDIDNCLIVQVAAAMAGEDMEVVAEVAGTEEVAAATEVCHSSWRPFLTTV